MSTRTAKTYSWKPSKGRLFFAKKSKNSGNNLGGAPGQPIIPGVDAGSRALLGRLNKNDLVEKKVNDYLEHGCLRQQPHKWDEKKGECKKCGDPMP